MVELDTPRLHIREIVTQDAEFILELLNDPAFIRFIGDRKVRTLDDARLYIENGPQRSYREFGFGLSLMQAKTDGVSVGMCGLLQRDYLPDPDIGFALLPKFRSLGLCAEAARAVLEYGVTNFKLKRIGAIVQPDNADSLKVLDKLGFAVDRAFKLSADGEAVLLLAYFS